MSPEPMSLSMIELALKAVIPFALIFFGINRISTIPHGSDGRILYLNPPFRRPMLVSDDAPHLKLMFVQAIFMVIGIAGLPWLSTQLPPNIANAMWRTGWLLAIVGVVLIYCLVEALAYRKELRDAKRISRHEGIARLAKHIGAERTKLNLRIGLIGLAFIGPMLITISILFTFSADTSVPLYRHIFFMELGLLMATLTLLGLPLLGYVTHLDNPSVNITADGYIVDSSENNQSELGNISRNSSIIGILSQLLFIVAFAIGGSVPGADGFEGVLPILLAVVGSVFFVISIVTTPIGILMGLSGLFQHGQEKRPACVGLVLATITAALIAIEVAAIYPRVS
ncbi:hypothetical protein P1P91_00740 [Halomonas piscis]|uniref:Uncharacterized protein n=1 Tax=Halomonas piscis TaxID=3031727 RepID=A0ABY9Z0R1_9GAMM|nr:hypothetical protein [Halomonas piscis]WNK20256.1 hypothetical protein P1P91_00740 [Halomonas piscis]